VRRSALLTAVCRARQDCSPTTEGHLLNFMAVRTGKEDPVLRGDVLVPSVDHRESQCGMVRLVTSSLYSPKVLQYKPLLAKATDVHY